MVGVVLKIAERCNINCTYCYYFNNVENSPYERDKKFRPELLPSLTKFLNSAVKASNSKELSVGLHGGEPLIIGKKYFKIICETIKNSIDSDIQLHLNIQTNSLLIDQEWLEIFKEYNISVGISLDGIKKINDQYRVDFQGKGTFDKIVSKIQLIKQFLPLENISILSVINPLQTAQEFYDLITDELGIKYFDILFPDFTHDSLPSDFDNKKYTDFTIDLFKIWLKDNEKRINIRFFNNIFQLLTGGSTMVYGFGKHHPNSLPLITIYADGSLSVTDELSSAVPSLYDRSLNINNINFEELIKQDSFQLVQKNLIDVIPDNCQNCNWKNICRGGAIENRYSIQNNFNNSSIFCDSLKNIFEIFSKSLLVNNYSIKELEIALNHCY